MDQFTRNCISCRPVDAKEKARTIYEDEVVRVVLRTDNQVWLGRFIVLPLKHLGPPEFWGEENKDFDQVRRVYCRVVAAVTKAFNATCVQMAQLGSLSVDENDQPTADQRYQHAHLHGIPRYAQPPVCNGKEWPDPQFTNGAFTALNIDPTKGLPKVIPTSDDIAAIVVEIQAHL